MQRVEAEQLLKLALNDYSASFRDGLCDSCLSRPVVDIQLDTQILQQAQRAISSTFRNGFNAA